MTDTSEAAEVQEPSTLSTNTFTADGSEMRWKFTLNNYEAVECDGRPQRIRPTKADVRLYQSDGRPPIWEISVAGLPVTAKNIDAEGRHPCSITNHRFKQGLLIELIEEIVATIDNSLPAAPPRPLDTEEESAMKGLRMVYGEITSKWPDEAIDRARELGLLREEEA